jgi:hypothetical protein
MYARGLRCQCGGAYGEKRCWPAFSPPVIAGLDTAIHDAVP